MGKLFLSYRRVQGHFVDRLAEALGKRISGTVFVDLTGINESDFEEVIFREIIACDVFILVVTPETFAPERINDQNDFVRREIAMALNPNLEGKRTKAKPIVLVLAEGLSPPDASLLPEDIRKIVTKQGIEFYRRFFDAGAEYLARFCERLVPDAFAHQSALYTPNHRNIERRLKQSIRDAIEQLIGQLLKEMSGTREETKKTYGYNAWSIAEGLRALLYTNSRAIFGQASGSIDKEVLTQIAWELVNIDEHIEGGGIPAHPDLRIPDRGVVDTTSLAISALCTLRVYMYKHSLDTLGKRNISIDLPKIDACISRLCTWLRQHQNNDHGWGLWQGTKSRVTATSWAILAFVDAGVDIEEPFLQKAQSWLIDTQKEDGWWSVTPDITEGDVTSTAFAIMAIARLSTTIMQENIQRGIYALETNTNWEDAEHKIELSVKQGRTNEIVPVLYASEPRAICALLAGGMSPTSPFLLNRLSQILDDELDSGGWTMKKTKNKKINIWYTYVVVECIYYWFNYCHQISDLVRLAKIDQALSGILRMYKAKEQEVQYLTQKLDAIKNILEQK